MSYIIAGIGTDVGKTVVSAILCETLKADYWKPVQAGDLNNTDSDKVRALVSHSSFVCHAETHRLSQPMSPHAAAERDDIQIKREGFRRPDTKGRPLLTELAGGLMVPLSETYLTIDLAIDIGDPVILVVNSYLGSINHTLLSIELLAQTGMQCAGLIFNGKTNVDSRSIILRYSGARLIGDIPHTDSLNKAFINIHAQIISKHL